MTSLFAGIQDAPLDPIMRLFEAFNADPSPKKLNLVVGVYTDADGKVPRLRAVQTAEKRWIEKGLPKTYRPIEGTKPFRDAVQELLFGKGAPILSQNRVATLQSIGGTGALKTGADVLAKLYPGATVAVSNPSWENHKALFSQAGFTVADYPYFSAETGGADYPAMKAYLQELAKGSIVVLHACCHNPTGADLSLDEWRDLVPLMAERGLIPFLDIAYQGFGNGLDADAEPVRLFAESGQEFLVASSFSKSFSLYGERVGALTIVAVRQAACSGELLEPPHPRRRDRRDRPHRSGAARRLGAGTRRNARPDPRHARPDGRQPAAAPSRARLRRHQDAEGHVLLHGPEPRGGHPASRGARGLRVGDRPDLRGCGQHPQHRSRHRRDRCRGEGLTSWWLSSASAGLTSGSIRSSMRG
jgi:hypothetical protein